MINKLIRWMGILTIIFFSNNSVLAAGLPQTIKSTTGETKLSAVTYTNPLSIQIPNDGLVESCADPTIIYSQTVGDNHWYMYCTTDPLNDSDKTGNDFNFHLIPMLSSVDLVHWTYRGDVFSARPSWVATTAGLWAPEIQFLNGQYYLYYTASDTALGGSAIGVATSTSPIRP